MRQRRSRLASPLLLALALGACGPTTTPQPDVVADEPAVEDSNAPDEQTPPQDAPLAEDVTPPEDAPVTADVAPSPDAPAMDAAAPDVAPPPDAPLADVTPMDAVSDGARDASTRDAAPDSARDSAPPSDAPAPADILGTVAGTCHTLRGMLASSGPSLLRNSLTFVAGETYSRDALSFDGRRLYDSLASSSSSESEVLSFELLHFCEDASLARTRAEITYAAPDGMGANTVTDMSVTIGTDRVGVNATRVYRPAPMTLSDDAVRTSLTSELQAVNRSTMRVLPADRWVKQVLHVFVVSDAIGDQVARVWATLDATLRSNTVVMVTATRGGGFLYCNPDPPLGSECPSL